MLMLLVGACGTSADIASPTPETPAEAAPDNNSAPSVASEVPRITAAELKGRLDGGEEIVIIDTRADSSYDIRHISGAILTPAAYDEFALDEEIVLYCA